MVNTVILLDNNIKDTGSLIKLVLDKVIAAIALVIFLPVALFLMIAIYLTLGSPIIFKQIRAGKDGKLFTIYKFRSMTNERDSDGNLLPDDQRIIPLGNFLRKTRLDEILQFWNILKGEMSFVGPRPTLPEQLDDYDDFQRLRLRVIPGMTGWHQVNGNNELTWNERICLDVWYLKHWTIWLDLFILLKTLSVITWGEYRNERALMKARRFESHLRRFDNSSSEVTMSS